MILEAFADNDAVLIDGLTGKTVLAGQIRERASDYLSISDQRSLAFLYCENEIEAYVDFIALIEAGIPTLLLDKRSRPQVLDEIILQYQPGFLVGGNLSADGYLEVRDRVLHKHPSVVPHEELSVMLTTSGSTGSHKFVRLSRENIRCNASQIAESLDLHAGDVGVSILPLHYSFGMSVLTSHLHVGARLLVTSLTVIEHDLWSAVDQLKVSIIPGVPVTFNMMKRLDLANLKASGLRALIQAGGRLPDTDARLFADIMRSRGGDLYVMYGQTEASPRISCFSLSSHPTKLGSVGKPMNGGHISIIDDGVELDSGSTGEIHYEGPNVMMGYAEKITDLQLGDVCQGRLETGDLGYLDSDGYLFITGRIKRISKLAGVRVSLDEIERMADDLGPIAAVDASDSGIVLFTTCIDIDKRNSARIRIARELSVVPSMINIVFIEKIPRLPSGKTDYQALKDLAEGD